MKTTVDENKKNKLNTLHDEMEQKHPFIQREFSVGSLVSIDGQKLDPEKYETKRTHLCFTVV